MLQLKQQVLDATAKDNKLKYAQLEQETLHRTIRFIALLVVVGLLFAFKSESVVRLLTVSARLLLFGVGFASGHGGGLSSHLIGPPSVNAAKP